MIHTVTISTLDGSMLVFREYGENTVDPDIIMGIMDMIAGTIASRDQVIIHDTEMDDSRVFHAIDHRTRLAFVLFADSEDDTIDTRAKLSRVIDAFVYKFEDLVKDDGWLDKKALFRAFEQEIDNIVLVPIKIAILGHGGVGKTTTLQLICGKDVNLEYIPTITTDIASFDGLGGNRLVMLWDFAGQTSFQETLWASLLEGTQVVLLVTDSTFENVQDTKRILDTMLSTRDNLMIIALANKQDLDNRLTAPFVQKILGVQTHDLSAIDGGYRERILEILRDTIEHVERGLVAATGEQAT